MSTNETNLFYCLDWSDDVLDINGKTVYDVGTDVKFIVCLADDIQPEDAKGMADYAPRRITFTDSCFSTTEQKSIVRVTLKDKGITIETL